MRIRIRRTAAERRRPSARRRALSGYSGPALGEGEIRTLVEELTSGLRVQWRTDPRRRQAERAVADAEAAVEEAQDSLEVPREQVAEAQSRRPAPAGAACAEEKRRTPIDMALEALRTAGNHLTECQGALRKAQAQQEEVERVALDQLVASAERRVPEIVMAWTEYNQARHGRPGLDPLPGDLVDQVVRRATRAVDLGDAP